MVVKHPVRGTNNGLAIAFRVNRDTDARLNIVLVRLDTLLQSEQIVGGKRQSLRRFEFRRNLDVIPHSEIQSDIGIHPPGILPEYADGNIGELVTGTA